MTGIYHSGLTTGTLKSGLDLEAMAERIGLIEDQAVDARNVGTARNLWDSCNHTVNFCIIYDAGFKQGPHDTFINEKFIFLQFPPQV